MRLIRALILPIITILVIILLDNSLKGLPSSGRLLDPVNGWAANAEPTDKNFSITLSFPGLNKPISVWFEDRLVPHIHAENDHDLYFAQGYLHAYFRLWQMDFQTRAAAGRIGEVVGEKWVKDEKTGKQKNAVLEFDRTQRRKGMVYAAENSLKTMEAEPRTKEMLDAYTSGINSYISSLEYKKFPVEYKLMGFEPEPWTNLKCALLLKYMADDLTGKTDDFALTVLKYNFPEEFDYLFPERLKWSIPVIPEGTKFPSPSLTIPPVPGDTIWTHFSNQSITQTETLNHESETDGIGSNNWAISGAHTSSGAPILCNDPHLGLNLPSLWFEMQLQAKDVNAYGVSLPGAPGIIIGFNDSISWGLTNNYRDVKDFYEIDAIDNDFYRFDGKAESFDKRIEVIKIKGKPDFVDTVDYTLHGPVMYDEHFPDPVNSNRKFAMCWMAHRGTNELLSVYKLNRTKNYNEFTEAIFHFECPAQNIVYADRDGNIAMWGQGQFINKWKDQGRFVMKGSTSATLWGDNIPMEENPHSLNPPQGYLASANQITTDSTYPYWYNGDFVDFRAIRINEILRIQNEMSNQKMEGMQNETYSILASKILPILLQYVGDSGLTDHQRKNLQMLKSWDYYLSRNQIAPTLFQVWWDKICSHFIFDEVTSKVTSKSEFVFDLINREDYNLKKNYAPYWENMRWDVVRTFIMATDSVEKIEQKLGSLEWYKVKNTTLAHLAKIPAFSYDHLKIGGWGNTINAAKSNHGPSWRMIVEMGKDSITAFGVYPGGQSGNPGSKYYGTFVNHWVEGKYYPIVFLPNQKEQSSKRIKYQWIITPQ